MTTPKLPSAEEILNGGHWLCITDKQRIERLRAYVHIVLEAAAQEALDHPEAPAEAILKLREN